MNPEVRRQINGVKFDPAPESAFGAIWCAWGYGKPFTPTQVEQALPEVKKLGQEALPQLSWALDKSLWLEVRHRIGPLVEKAKRAKLTADQTRLQRTLLVFELIATVKARQVLEEVVKGSAGAWLAPEAQASLKRLENEPTRLSGATKHDLARL